MEKREVVIIGSGPAGHTAAIYTARANLKPLILEGHEAGGQLTMTTLVENFPGFPEGVMGPELMSNMKAQAEHFSAEYRATSVIDIDLRKRPFLVSTEDGNVIEAQTVIIATGASANLMGLPHEKELIGKGVSTCATCDGFFYRGKIVHVVGGGDTALEEANFLTKFASKVYIVHRRGELRASKAMQERTFENRKIELLWHSEVVKLQSNNSGLTGLVVKNTKTGELHERPTDGLFYAIGHTPNTKFLKGQVKTDEKGFIITHNQVETNIPGLFACGDVQDNYYRQAISAAGSGCHAALRAERFLESHSS